MSTLKGKGPSKFNGRKFECIIWKKGTHDKIKLQIQYEKKWDFS